MPTLQGPRLSRGLIAILAALTIALAPSEGQAQQSTPAPAPAPCLGYSYNTRPARLLAAGLQQVMEVRPGTPAEAGGLRAGDIMVSVDGVPTISEAAPRLTPGDTIDYVVSRDGRNVTLVMVVGQREPVPSGDPVCRPVPRPGSNR